MSNEHPSFLLSIDTVRAGSAAPPATTGGRTDSELNNRQYIIDHDAPSVECLDWIDEQQRGIRNRHIPRIQKYRCFAKAPFIIIVFVRTSIDPSVQSSASCSSFYHFQKHLDMTTPSPCMH